MKMFITAIRRQLNLKRIGRTLEILLVFVSSQLIGQNKAEENYRITSATAPRKPIEKSGRRWQYLPSRQFLV